MSAGNTDSTDRFRGFMLILMALAGVAWLVLALLNVRRGGSFSWTSLGVFILLLVGINLGRARRRGR